MQAESKEEYINVWNDHIDSLRPAMWEIEDRKDKEEMVNSLVRLKELIKKSAEEMENSGKFS